MIDSNKVVEALRTIIDPGTGLDIISAKLVSELKVDGNKVSFALNNTKLDDKLKSQINFLAISSIQQVYADADVHVHMHSDAQAAKDIALPQVNNIIAVASGKGGVGKSTMSVNLAYGLKKRGFRVGILDADLYGPSLPTMLGIQGSRPKIENVYGKSKIRPIEHEGVHVISIGFIIEPQQAVVLRGPRLGGIIKQFINDCLWPELDFLIIDLPPGTGDIQLTMVQTVPVSGAIMVTTPQEVAIVDAIKAMNMFRLPNVNVPILGIIENMSWFTPAELPENKYYIFGEGGGKRLAQEANTVLMGQMPLVKGIREGGDKGLPIIMGEDESSQIVHEQYEKIINKFLQQLVIRNETQKPTETVKINT